VIHVMIVEDTDLLRDALTALLAKEHDLAVVAGIGAADDAAAAAVTHRPDVVIIDLDGAEPARLDLARRLVHQTPTIRVLALTGAPTTDALHRALAARVVGFLGKDVSPDEVTAAVRQVAAGRRVIDPALAAGLLRRAENPLTDRERAVLRLAAKGARATDIAEQLGLAAGTVRNYLSAIMRKTGTHNRLAAARRAEEAGWL